MQLFLAALIISIFSTLILYGPIQRLLSGANCTKPNFRKKYVVSGFGVLLPTVSLVSAGLFSIQFFARTGLNFVSSNLVFLLLLVVVTGLSGFIDDLLGNRVIGGLRGHFSQLRYGVMTTGTLKAIIGLSIASVVAAALSANIIDFLINLVVLALSINAANLFDLRPGRAIKVFTLVMAAVFISTWRSDFWGVFGFIIPPIAGLLWGDLKEQSMIGDSGANPLGAIIGLTFVINLSLVANLIVAAVLVALHLISEKYSISQFVESTPILRQLDELGWKR